jgi:hypothetical protein
VPGFVGVQLDEGGRVGEDAHSRPRATSSGKGVPRPAGRFGVGAAVPWPTLHEHAGACEPFPYPLGLGAGGFGAGGGAEHAGDELVHAPARAGGALTDPFGSSSGARHVTCATQSC